MIGFTKERIEQFIKNPLEHGLTRSEQMEMARQLLTSMEQEPVAFIDRANLDYLESGADADVWPASGAGSDDVLLYAAPQLPQPAVPDIATVEKTYPDVQTNWQDAKMYAEGWNAYRAAMLQGAEPVTTAYKLPFDQWLSQQTGTIDVECGCVMTEVFFHWLRVAYEAGNSPVIPDEKGSSLQLRNLIRQRHAEWSQATFGDVGPVGPLKHLSKEALEAAAEPEDLSEWADMQFLLWDAQRRAGISDVEITAAMEEKLKVNMARQWPEPKNGEPRQHIKTEVKP